MEITLKIKVERFAYSTTINNSEAICTIVLGNGARRQAYVECSGITLRKPKDEVSVGVEGKLQELPSNVNEVINSLTEFLNACIAKHEGVGE